MVVILIVVDDAGAVVGLEVVLRHFDCFFELLASIEELAVLLLDAIELSL